MNLEEYRVIVETLAATPILRALSRSNHPKIITFLENLLLFLGQNSHQTAEFVYYLACLRIVGAMNI